MKSKYVVIEESNGTRFTDVIIVAGKTKLCLSSGTYDRKTGEWIVGGRRIIGYFATEQAAWRFQQDDK